MDSQKAEFVLSQHATCTYQLIDLGLKDLSCIVNEVISVLIPTFLYIYMMQKYRLLGLSRYIEP